MSRSSLMGLKIAVGGHLHHAQKMYDKRPERNGYWYKELRKYEHAWTAIKEYEGRANERQ